MADLHETVRQDVLEEPADQLDGVEVGGTPPSAAGFAVGEGDGAVFERDDSAIGDGDLEDLRGEVFERRMAARMGLAVDIPGDGPDLRVDVLQKSGLADVLSEDGTVDGRKRFDRNQEVGSGG
jgi:hypothetical protein